MLLCFQNGSGHCKVMLQSPIGWTKLPLLLLPTPTCTNLDFLCSTCMYINGCKTVWVMGGLKNTLENNQGK